MPTFHYACLVEAGDVLYEAGETSLNREVSQIVAQHSIQMAVRRSFLYHDSTVSYLRDMAIVFVVVSELETDVRLIFACLQMVKKKFRDPERALHFETTLASILQSYNVDMTKEDNENVKRILHEMESIPMVQKETIEMGVPIDELRTSTTTLQEIINVPEPTGPEPKRRSSRHILILLATFAIIIGLVTLIVWTSQLQRASGPRRKHVLL